MKIAITVLNVISALAILPYPGIVIAGVMAGDSPSSGNILPWIILLLSLGYPFIIGGIIFLSQRHDSLSLALIALVPLIVLVYVFIISGGTVQKNNFNTLQKDCVCDPGSFLSLGGKETDPIRGLMLLEKRNFFTYRKNDIASVYGNKWINSERINSKDTRDRTDQLLNSCKNTEGKTPVQVYSKIEDGQVKEILKQI